MKRIACSLLVALLLFACGSTGETVSYEICPPEISGRVIYIPFPCSITVDGDLSDWEGLPHSVVDRGPMAGAEDRFTFAVAARENTFYLYMIADDPHIITGQHGKDFWNEDSLEVYFNFSDDLFASSYGEHIYQININPGDRGNRDPKALTLTGSNSSLAEVSGHVFDREEGWGCELAVTMPFTAEHGKEIGFQAHMNGASEKDRDVKLIWSRNDEKDHSYQNPRLFGQGLFFEIGADTLPPYSLFGEDKPDSHIAVNQTGYFPDGPKEALFPWEKKTGTFEWSLVKEETGEVVYGGTTEKSLFDQASGDYINRIDFSDFREEGRYHLTIPSENVTSESFSIGDDIYSNLPMESMAYFYRNRAGIAIEARYAGGEEYARGPGHLSDGEVTGFKGKDPSGRFWEGTEYTLDAAKGWYDAGDVGKYVVNGGIAAWTLMNTEDCLPGYFADGTLSLPEQENGVPDVLDEARWEMEFLLAMQVPAGYEQAGMVHHKLHDVHWGPIPWLPPAQYDNDNGHSDPDKGRYLMPPSTAATLNLAATAAQSSRLWADYDEEFSRTCLEAAEKAWIAARDNPIFLYGNIPGEGGGNYDDGNVEDEFFWAAAELYAATGKEPYRDYLQNSPYYDDLREFSPTAPSAIWWGGTATLGRITLATVENGLEEQEKELFRSQIITMADYYLGLTDEGYGPSLPPTGYVWGSNSNMLNNALLIAYAHRFTGEEKYREGLLSCLDYLLGKNALNRSYISGYGSKALSHPLHHFWADQPDKGFPKVPAGVLAGGPNESPSDPTAQTPEIMARGVSKRYVDSSKSWSTNEVAINWNSPLVWISAYVDGAINK
ncbi:MAG: glycoside hydrolase family 9 protein [Spirochaetales bacterium]|nr:glycoside hydrolase family 9 protein [Spirochaetales bacterium]